MSDSVILWTIAFQAPPSMGFSRQEYWDSLDKNTGVGCYSILQGISLTQGYNPHLLHHLHWQGVLYITWEAWFHYIYCPFANWLVYLFKVELWEVFQCVCVCVCVCVWCADDSPSGSDGKESAWNAGAVGSVLGSRRSPVEGNGNPLRDLATKTTTNKGHLNLLSTTFKYLIQYC